MLPSRRPHKSLADRTPCGVVPQSACGVRVSTTRAEFRSRQQRLPSRFYPFLYERFHVLLNSLFKVLCNFPSRYLLAIGLAAVLSSVLEGVYLPLWAALSSNPTLGEIDSSGRGTALRRRNFARRTGLSSSTDISPDQRDSNERSTGSLQIDSLTSHGSDGNFVRCRRASTLDSVPFHSPLLGKSSLVSFPPLSYMLKFSG